MQANKGGSAVLTVLQQVAEYDAIEHEGKLAELISPADPNAIQPYEVLWGLLSLLDAMALGQDTCITVQALGDLHGGGLDDYDRDTAISTAERQAVADAEAFAGALSKALRMIVFRPQHGINEL